MPAIRREFMANASYREYIRKSISLYIRNQFIGNKGIFNGYRQSVAKTQTHDYGT